MVRCELGRVGRGLLAIVMLERMYQNGGVKKPRGCFMEVDLDVAEEC